MQPDPRQLRRVQWLPPLAPRGWLPPLPPGGLLPPLRLQLRLPPPPDSLSPELLRELERAHGRRRILTGVISALAVFGLAAGSVPGAAASGSGAGSSLAGVGLGSTIAGGADRFGAPWAIVPDNAGKGNGDLGGLPTTTTTPGTVPIPVVNDLGMPEVALDAYRTAAASLGEADPDCRIAWPLIAGIGRVESDHGRYGGRQPAADGSVLPPILGIPWTGGPASP